MPEPMLITFSLKETVHRFKEGNPESSSLMVEITV